MGDNGCLHVCCLVAICCVYIIFYCIYFISKFLTYLGYIFCWGAGPAQIIISMYHLIAYPGKGYGAITEGMSNDMWVASMCTMLAVGILMLPVGAVGFYGSYKQRHKNGKKHPHCLCLYSILMAGVLLLQLFVAIFLEKHINEVDDYLVANLKNQVKHNYTGEADDPMTEAWDKLQQDVECCGAYGYRDYSNSYYHTTSGNLVPESCCVMDGDHPKNYTVCLQDAENRVYVSDNLYTEGCYSKGSDSINEFAGIIENMVLVLAFIEIACIIMGFSVWCHFPSILERCETSPPTPPPPRPTPPPREYDVYIVPRN